METEVKRLETLPEVIGFCKLNNLPAEVVGVWVWLSFDAKPDEAIRTMLKSAGFRWVHKRGMWAHSCGTPCRHGIGDPRYKYGSIPVNQIDENRLSA